MDLFTEKSFHPMLVGAEGEPFDSPDYIYELKLDGERAVVYLDKTGAELRNKRNKKMLPVFPELAGLHKQVKKPCILDGEYVAFLDGKPSFAEVQRRSLLSNTFKIELAAKQRPVTFVAFDLVWLDGKDLTQLPLMERKALLTKTVKEGERIAASRYLEGQGIALYQAAEAQGLEGIISKKKDSLYWPGKRTQDWIKSKNLLDDDFVVCGYIDKGKGVTSLVLGQYDAAGKLQYKGHVTMGVSGEAYQRITAQRKIPAPVMEVPSGHSNDKAVWIEPALVCTVKFMEYTANGGLRQPVLKGLRDDKKPEECKGISSKFFPHGRNMAVIPQKAFSPKGKIVPK